MDNNMTNILAKTLSLLTTGLLISCGGGGTNSSQDITSDITIELSSIKVVNLNGITPTDTIILPSNEVYIDWTATILDRGNLPDKDTDRLYNAKVYLSDDQSVSSNDLLIADNNCEVISSTHACATIGRITCTYLTAGESVFTCNSVGLNSIDPLVNFTSSTTDFIDLIPKSTNVLVEACLESDSSNCALISHTITLN